MASGAGCREFPQTTYHRAGARDHLRLATFLDCDFVVCGFHAATVADFCAALPDRPLPGVLLSEAEVIWFVRREHARHLADVLQRRSPVAIRGDLSLALVNATARVMARECGWTDAKLQTEIDQFLAEIGTYHGVHLPPSQGDAT